MSTSEEQSSASNYLCHHCGTMNTNRTRCVQCQSEFLEAIPAQTVHTEHISDNTERQLSNENDQQETPLIEEFQNLFSNDIQAFSNLLLPMLMSRVQPDLPQHRHRRGRPPRRIKRITHPPLVHRYLPSVDFSPFQATNSPTTQIQLFNINESLPGPVSNPQFQLDNTLIQVPLQLFVFDPNRENFNSGILTQFLNEDNDVVPVTREEINQLPTLTMTQSNLSMHPSCAICLETFDPLSEVKQLPICHHVFHTNCLTEWLVRHANCPMCRTRISSIQRPPFSLFHDQSMQRLLFRTFGQQQQQQQQTNTIVPIKTINPPQTSSTTTVSDQPSSNTPQLPRFDSSTTTE